MPRAVKTRGSGDEVPSAIDSGNEAAGGDSAAGKNSLFLLLWLLRLRVSPKYAPGLSLTAFSPEISLYVDVTPRAPCPFFFHARSGWVICRQCWFVSGLLSCGGGGARGAASSTPIWARPDTPCLFLFRDARPLFLLGAASTSDTSSKNLAGSNKTFRVAAVAESFHTAFPVIRCLRLETPVVAELLVVPSLLPGTAGEGFGLLLRLLVPPDNFAKHWARFRLSIELKGDGLRDLLKSALSGF